MSDNIKCAICDKNFKSMRGLSSHIKRIHNYSDPKEYYDKYLISKNEKSTTCKKWLNISLGYEIIDESLLIIPCKKCGDKFRNYSELQSHVRHHHKISSKEYYDEYVLDEISNRYCRYCGNENTFKNSNEGYSDICSSCNLLSSQELYDRFLLPSNSDKKCQVCGCDVKFRDIEYGYNVFCSDVCRYSKEGISIMQNKSKSTCKDIYGVEYSLQADIVKSKARKSCLEKYGTEYAIQNEDIFNKVKSTNLKKRGVENISQCSKVKYDKKITCLEKYGTEYASQSEVVKQKVVNTCLKRYNVTNYTKTAEYLEKTKNTNNIKYNVDHHSQSDKVKKKTLNTNFKKYGVSSYTKTDEYLDKSKNTNLKNRGVEYPTQSSDVMDKIRTTNLKNHGVENISQSNDIKKAKLSTFRESNWDNYLLGLSNKNLKPLHDKKEYLNISCDFYEYECLDCGNVIVSETPVVSKIYCKNHISKQEECLNKLIQDLDLKPQQNKRFNIDDKTKREIDIYLSDLKIGFEYNGIYWHSNKFKENDYHFNKKFKLKQVQDIDIIHIYSDSLDRTKQLKKFIKTITSTHVINNPIITEITQDEYMYLYDSISIKSNNINDGRYYKVDDGDVICVFSTTDIICDLVYTKMNPKLFQIIRDYVGIYDVVLDYDIYLERHFVDKETNSYYIDPSINYYTSSNKLITESELNTNILEVYNSGKIVLTL